MNDFFIRNGTKETAADRGAEVLCCVWSVNSGKKAKRKDQASLVYA